jgi:U3 small nucleolar RNA-associated protein 10
LVLEIIDRFLEKKGENYLTVLPDSVPLLAEALEDDNGRVEANCRKLIKKMETIFGHSVESYFE